MQCLESIPMKKLILGLITLLSFNQVFAQTFTTQAGDTAYAAFQNAGTEVKVSNPIVNTTSAPLFLKWRMHASDLNNGWALNGFCDNVTCYVQVGNSWYVSDGYAPSTPGVFYALFDGDNAASNSSAWIQLNVLDTVNTYNKLVTFVATKGTNNVVNVSRSEDDVVLFPNPARNNLNIVINNNSMGVKSVAVYNLIGKAVSHYRINGNNAKLELTEIPSGIYFVRLMNSKGQVVATRKFTKQ